MTTLHAFLPSTVTVTSAFWPDQGESNNDSLPTKSVLLAAWCRVYGLFRLIVEPESIGKLALFIS